MKAEASEDRCDVSSELMILFEEEHERGLTTRSQAETLSSQWLGSLICIQLENGGLSIQAHNRAEENVALMAFL